MRVALVFPPSASPTYTPLGVAALSAFLADRLRSAKIATVDANLDAWEWIAGDVEKGHDCIRFLRGQEGDFFDRELYREQQATWELMDVALGRLGTRLKHSLGAGGEPDAIDPVLDALTSSILSSDPELVGFSLFSLSQVVWTVALAQRIARRRGTTRPRIILGGAACPALNVEELLVACSSVDGVVLGEGEIPLLRLAAGAPLEKVPGLVYRKDGGIARNRQPDTSSLKSMPPPDFGALPLGRYFNPSPVLPVLYSRGCKWRRCRFCAHNSSFGGYRTKGAERCVGELEGYARRHGATHFYFADLYVDAPDLESLADELLGRGLPVHYHALGRPTGEYSFHRLEKLASTGLRWVSWGVESGSQRLLDVAGKGTNAETAARVLADARSAGISNLMMMIFGLPTSCDADLQQTFDFIERVYADIDAMTASAFALFRNTPFARNARRFGLTVAGPHEELRVGERPIHSSRLHFREIGEHGGLRPPRGPVEVGEWLRRRRWLGEVPFLEGVACEHYLLHVSRRAGHTVASPSTPRRHAA